MAGQQYRLKATKTGLYALVRRHFEVPVKCRKAEFHKIPGLRDYALDFSHEGRLYNFFLAPFGGKVTLSRTLTGLSGARTWDTADISLSERLELDLVEKVTVQRTLPQQ